MRNSGLMWHGKSVYRCARRQLANFSKPIRGEPVTTPSFASMTVDRDDVNEVNDWLARREEWHDPAVVCRYEEEFAHWNGSEHAFAFMGGRVALSACLDALDLQPGDEVILPGYTCVVVPNAIKYADLLPVYCDIELETFGLDASSFRSRITSRTRAVILQHFYGLVCRDYEEILDIARQHHIRVIEDCAHATGAEYRGVKVGNRGDVGFYSSEQSKSFNTVQGGVAISNNNEISERLHEFYVAATEPDQEWIQRQLINVKLNFYTYRHKWRGILADVAHWRYG